MCSAWECILPIWVALLKQTVKNGHSSDTRRCSASFLVTVSIAEHAVHGDQRTAKRVTPVQVALSRTPRQKASWCAVRGSANNMLGLKDSVQRLLIVELICRTVT